jgi:aminopeptidase-like protein
LANGDASEMTPEEIKEFSKLQERIVVYRRMEDLNKKLEHLYERLFSLKPDEQFMITYETSYTTDHYGADATHYVQQYYMTRNIREIVTRLDKDTKLYIVKEIKV